MKKTNILNLVTNPWKMKLYLFLNLPMAFLAGLKVVSASPERVTIKAPYGFINKNPFKSMYFAVQSMAAELSSGILALSVVKSSEIPVSMLVLNMKASFLKKARTPVEFTCENGKEISDTIARCISTKEGHTIDVVSVGIDTYGEKVAEFTFTWTFKPKNY